MKNIRFSAAFVAAMMMVGCSGENPVDEPNIGGNGGNEGGEEVVDPAQGLKIVADKTEVEADGVDAVTFTVVMTDENGVEEELTSQYPRAVRIKDVNTGETLPFKTFTTTSIENKEAKYIATYEDTESANSVDVKFHNREKYEKYYQKVAVVELTGTWCIGCPQMVDALENMDDDKKEHTVLIALHVTDDEDNFDPFTPVTNVRLGQDILKEFGRGSLPNCIFDLNEINDVATKANVGNIVYSYLVEHYATCGVKVVSSSLDGLTLKVKAAMTSVKAGTYDLGWALVCDGFQYAGGTIESGIYNDVLIATSENFYKMSSDRFSAEPDVEVTKEFTFELPSLPEQFDAAKAKIIVFALTSIENEYNQVIVDNITECPLGQGNDYVLN